MITLTVDNRRVTIKGAPRSIIREIEEITSYLVAGFMFVPSFRAKRWDGKEHLLTYSNKHGYRAPSGLTIDIARKLKELDFPFKVVNKTKIRHKRTKLAWDESVVLRDYQNLAVEKALSKPFPGMGILKMPIRSGKTKTAAKLIQRIGRPVLFIVPSLSLLHQTYEALKEVLYDAEIGRIGDNLFEPEFITVATIQTLSRMRDIRPKAVRVKGGRPKSDPRYKELMTQFDVAVFDECHHVRGEGGWYHVMYDLDCRFKFGLSATAFLDSETEHERGIIWMKACCGPIRIDVATSDLVERGFLMRQHVTMHRIKGPKKLLNAKWSATLIKRAITHNKVRNRYICKLAQRYSETMKVIIIVRQLVHIEQICDGLDDLDVDYRTITGADDSEERASKVEGFVDGDYSVVIGTVLGEGIDIPSIEVVINAEGGKDTKSTIQRQRNLTISKGKKRALLIDFYDEMNSYMLKHSQERLAQYESEPAFKVTLR